MCSSLRVEANEMFFCFAQDQLGQTHCLGSSHVPPPPAAVDGLTPRELEVLRLVAKGRSNAEIAAALFIGPGTVRTHVSAILAKLNAKSRTEAAHLALRSGLV